MRYAIIALILILSGCLSALNVGDGLCADWPKGYPEINTTVPSTNIAAGFPPELVYPGSEMVSNGLPQGSGETLKFTNFFCSTSSVDDIFVYYNTLDNWRLSVQPGPPDPRYGDLKMLRGPQENSTYMASVHVFDAGGKTVVKVVVIDVDL